MQKFPTILKTIVATTLILSASSAVADNGIQFGQTSSGLHLIELDKFGMEYWKTQNNDDPYYSGVIQDPEGATGEHWTDGAATTFNLNLVRYQDYSLYWRNYVHMDDTNKQVRQVGWQWEAGVSLQEKVEFFWYHHSQHLLDESTVSGDHFPLQNKYGVRVNFYQRDK